MKQGDLIRIRSIKKTITGIIVSSAKEEPEGWTMIMDQFGRIIWWPPQDIVCMNDKIERIKRHGRDQ